MKNKNQKSQKDGDNAMEKSINTFNFVLGILTCLPGIDEYAEKIEDILDNTDKCEKEDIIEAYKKGIEIRQEKRFAAAITTLDNLESTKKELPWRPTKENDEKIKNLEASNPKKACQAILAEKERQKKENNKYIEVYAGALKAAKKIRETNMSFDQFLKKLPSFRLFRSSNKYLNLKRYFKRVIFSNLKLKTIYDLKPKIDRGEENWKDLINEAIFILSSNEEMAKHNLLQLSDDKQEKPDCSKLPTDTVFKNNKVTILDKFAGGWSALKFIGKCVLESLPNIGYEYLKDHLLDLLKEIGIEFLKKLLTVFGTVITNMLTFFAAKAFKILWWIIKAVYYIYKAINEEGEKYKYWGKAVGSGIRIIYIAFMPTERRRFKL